MNWKPVLIRVTALSIFFSSAAYAYSGFYLFQGDENLRGKQYEKAFLFYQKAELPFSRKAAVFEGSSLSGLELKPEAKKDLALWVEYAPLNAKARVTLAEAEGMRIKSENKKLSEADKKKLQDLLEEASRLEPGNAGIAYRCGVLWLTFRSSLNSDEIRRGLEWLKKGARIKFLNPDWRYIEDPSPYLKPALIFLFSQNAPYSDLAFIVPGDYLSQRAWMDFLAANNLWSYRQSAYAFFQETAEKYYDYECARGMEFLRKRMYLRAYFSFRKAFWSRDWAHVRAKAGILAADYFLGNDPSEPQELMKGKTAILLEQILNEKDAPIEPELLNYLKGPVEREKNPALLSLWESKRVTEEPVPGELKPYDSSLWWGDGIQVPLRVGAKMNYPLTLAAGKILGSVHLKVSSEGGRRAWAVFSVRVNQREVAEFLADNKGNETPYSFEYFSAGGERWLQLEVIQISARDLKAEYNDIEVKLAGEED